MAEIAVVGAGIAGLASGAALTCRGHSVTVIEERTDTSSGAGISIWPNALAALDQLGLGDPVRAAGGRVTAGAIRWKDGAWLRRPSGERIVTALGEPLVVLQRFALRDILAGALAPGAVVDGVAVRDLSATATGVRLHLTDSSTRDVEAVIGADGTGSVVARHLNGSLPHRYAGYTAWRGVSSLAIDPDLAGETIGPGAEVGHVPTGPDRTYWFATERTTEGATAPRGELDYLHAKFASWAAPIPAMLAATEPRRGSAQRPLRPRPSPALGRGTGGAGGRCRPSHAAAPGSGRLSGAGGCRRTGRVCRPVPRPAKRLRRI
jgi:2-polyprenyl-6-methoxyphenol hydroxylase-like FAD-dependent oxidoreductase